MGLTNLPNAFHKVETQKTADIGESVMNIKVRMAGNPG